MRLASRFASSAVTLRAETPLSDEQILAVAPSIFAEDKHESRSDRYAYIPTGQVLARLRLEGFSPFMVCQTRVREEGRRAHTKHLVRLRHAEQIGQEEADEIILLNSHDGSSSYQLLAGMFRFVCKNGLVCGEAVADVRIPHKGDVVDLVTQAACDVQGRFEQVHAARDAMRAISLTRGEQEVFGRAALALKYDSEIEPAPISERQLLEARRPEDAGSDLWRTFNRVQENLIQGQLPGRARTGRRLTTRPVQGMNENMRLNRALWVLAEEMRRMKA